MECCKMVCKNDKVGFWCVKMTFFMRELMRMLLAHLMLALLDCIFLLYPPYLKNIKKIKNR